jgi:hypothetical protein
VQPQDKPYERPHRNFCIVTGDGIGQHQYAVLVKEFEQPAGDGRHSVCPESAGESLACKYAPYGLCILAVEGIYGPYIVKDIVLDLFGLAGFV